MTTVNERNDCYHDRGKNLVENKQTENGNVPGRTCQTRIVLFFRQIPVRGHLSASGHKKSTQLLGLGLATDAPDIFSKLSNKCQYKVLLYLPPFGRNLTFKIYLLNLTPFCEVENGTNRNVNLPNSTSIHTIGLSCTI